MNLFQNNARSWLIFPSHVILVPTVEWPFARKKNNIGQPFMQKNPFLGRKFLLGMNLSQNNAHNWLVFFSSVIFVPTIEWPFAHIESNIGQPIYEKNPFLWKKISFGQEPVSKQYPQLTSFPFTCNISTYNWMTFCTHKK